MANPSNASGSLRQEAGPRPLDTLSPGPEGQQQAVAELLRRLNETLDEIDKKGIGSQLAEASSLGTRRSRLQFWSGEPGIGKTSTYLAVRDWFDKQRGHKGAFQDGMHHLEKSLQKQIQAILHHTHRIRWLEPLDLEPLSGRPNFLASVAVRIDKCLALDAQDERDSWLTAGASDFREAVADFQRLKNEIALSWEGNLSARGGALDPDVYASEVIRAENARLDVNLRFGKVITKLAVHASEHQKDSSLVFILPIDDFYIQPNLTLEILRLLRMISCPHLFILMLGDMDHLEQLAFCHGLGEISNLSGKGIDILSPQRKGHISWLTDTRAAAALSKLIPVNHQFRILPMRADDTLKCKPQLGEFNLKARLTSFIDGLLTENVDDIKFYKDLIFEPKKRPWFVGHALETTPRHAADLYQSLCELAHRRQSRIEEELETEKLKREERKDILQVISDQVARTLFESLPTEVAEQVWSKMSVNWDDFYRRSFPSSALTIQPVKVKAESQDGTEIREESRFRIIVKTSGETDATGNDDEIPPRPRGWLTILYYVLRHYEREDCEPIDILESLKDSWKAPMPEGSASPKDAEGQTVTSMTDAGVDHHDK